MPSEPEAHADTGVMTPALAWRSRPTAAAGPLGMYICTASGDTAAMPRSRMSSHANTNASAAPRPVPIDTARRLVSTSGLPALSHTRRPSTVDIFCT